MNLKNKKMKNLIENAKTKAISSIKEDIEDGDLNLSTSDTFSLIKAIKGSNGETNVGVIKTLLSGKNLFDVYKSYCIVKVLDKSKNMIVEINLDSTGDWNGKVYHSNIYLWGDKVKL